MKRQLLSILTAIAVVISLSACQAGDTEQAPPLSEAAVSETAVALETTTQSGIEQALETSNFEYDNKVFISDDEITNDDIKEISLQSNIHELTIYFYNKDSQTELSLKPLSALSELKALRLGGYCTDLSIIDGMESLEKIEIIENFGITDLNDLGYNNKVKELTISSAIIENIDNIIQLPNLEKLTIENIDSSKNINLSYIGELNKLDTIYLKWLNIDSIGFVEKLNNLQKLFIWSNNVNVQDYENISKCTELDELCIYNIDLENLEFLSTISSLVDLELRWGKIADISALTQIHSLKKLELWGLPYSDYLCEMDNLNELIIYETELTSEQIDNLKKNLQSCTIMY